jgi:outer membrane protein OmpA-like peptidoglycan-associated protein
MLRASLFLFLLFGLSGFGQKKTDTLRLYFAINEINSPQNNARIDSAIKSLNGKLVDIAIYGYADFLSNDAYNLDLSSRRAETTKAYLKKKMPPSQINIYACEGRGEKNSTPNSSTEGQPNQRRVDIYFEPIVILNVSDSKLETPPSKDTVAPAPQKKNIEELSAGESLALEGLGFEPGRHFILKESVPVLQKLLQTLKENKTLKIEIQGHVCCTQNGADGMDLDTREMKLSENRAKAVYDFLISKGVDKNRLSYKGFGRTKPKFDLELTPEEEQANRRVEIMVLEK